METAETEQKEEITAEMLFQRLAEEPAARDILYAVLVFCKDERTIQQIEEHISALSVNKVLMHSPQTIITWLLSWGGIQEVSGEEGSGKLATTEIGNTIVDYAKPADRLNDLLADGTEFLDVFFLVLETCAEPKTKDEIETLLESDQRLTQAGIYAGYFIGELEEAGGLVWTGRWETTPEGKEALTAYRHS